MCTYLELSQEFIHTIKSNVSVVGLFPELQNAQIMELMLQPKGTVIKYTPKGLTSEDSNDEREGENSKTFLLWVRVVKNYWDSPDFFLLLFSPVLDEFAHEYIRNCSSTRSSPQL